MENNNPQEAGTRQEVMSAKPTKNQEDAMAAILNADRYMVVTADRGADGKVIFKICFNDLISLAGLIEAAQDFKNDMTADRTEIQ